jgi:hypothetical protein
MDNPPHHETPEPVQKARRFLFPAGALLMLLIIAAVGTYSWFFLYKPCEVNAVQEASATLVSQLNFYDRVYQVATNASRTSLVRPVATLQQILMDTQQITVPVCMQTAKNELINYMGTVIRAFQSYAAGEPDVAILDLLKESDAQYANFKAEMDAINKCAPFCFP